MSEEGEEREVLHSAYNGTLLMVRNLKTGQYEVLDFYDGAMEFDNHQEALNFFSEIVDELGQED